MNISDPTFLYYGDNYISGSFYITNNKLFNTGSSWLNVERLPEKQEVRNIRIEGIPTITCEYCGNIYNKNLFITTQMLFSCFTCGARLKNV